METTQKPPNLVLTGFMGTGKTAVGREVARRLGRPFVDMDAEIESRAGRPIAALFAEKGEAAFREREAALCAELSARQGLVVATGGGTLVDPQNRARMLASGTVVCLTCGVEEILRRVQEPVHRPLLETPEPRARIEQLLAQRRTAYRAIPWQVDTTGRPVEAVVEEVLALARVETLPVRSPAGPYDVHVGRGLLDHVGGALAAAGAPLGSAELTNAGAASGGLFAPGQPGASGVPEGTRVAVVSNPVVAPLYRERVEESLRRAGLVPLSCTVPDGERFKTLDTVSKLYDQFLAGGLERGDTVLALGGGVTGDLAGFAAATYLRGVRFVQVPTTLLAMVDAGVGGKTGVDLPQGKNLVGAFWQPAVVVVDPAVLATLPAAHLRAGTAEAIKQALIGAPPLLDELEMAAGDLERWWGAAGPSWLARALRVKVAVVEEDPLEQGRRAVLNLGHTVGHALEQLSGYELLHGQAVAIGLVAAARMAVELGRAGRELAQRVERVLRVWGLPVRCPPRSVDEVQAAIGFDKKRRGSAVRWVLPRAVGRVEVGVEVPDAVVRRVLSGMGGHPHG